MAATPGNPNNVKVGPGLIYMNVVGAPEPNDLTTPWSTVNANWAWMGYTEEGNEFQSEPSFEPIEVAESKLPIRWEEANKTESVTFAAAEITKQNLIYAFNGGTVTTLSGSVVRYNPPNVGNAGRVAIGWESDDGKERWVWRKCVQAGAVTIARRKSPEKALIAMTFNLEVVSPSVTPWTAVIDDAA